MSRILITGRIGRGRGTIVAPAAGARTRRFTVADLRQTDLPNYDRCDVADYRLLDSLFDEHSFDVVYHGRGGVRALERRGLLRDALADQRRRHQERHPSAGALRFRLVHFSSSEVYGDWPELMVETVMDEYEIKQMNDYAMTKWVNEMQIRNSAIQYGTESVVVRSSTPTGRASTTAPIAR